MIVAALDRFERAEALGTREHRDVIEQDEIQGRTETDAFALIATLRPTWLRVRGGRGGAIQVYVNGQRRLVSKSISQQPRT